ncbi:hypothetical protein [Streptomyces sp. NPDC004546]
MSRLIACPPGDAIVGHHLRGSGRTSTDLPGVPAGPFMPEWQQDADLVA